MIVKTAPKNKRIKSLPEVIDKKVAQAVPGTMVTVTSMKVNESFSLKANILSAWCFESVFVMYNVWYCMVNY